MKRIGILIALLFVFQTVPVLLSAAAPEGIGKSLSEIVALAKKERKVRFCSSSPDEKAAKKFLQGFHEKYPGITVEYTRCRGTATRERILSELLAGQVDYDLIHVSGVLIPKYKKAGVLVGPFDWEELFSVKPIYISPDRFFVAAGASTYGMVYNPKVVPKKLVPRTWEDCLDPYWKGKFLVDTRPNTFVNLYWAWGKEKFLNYARRLAANKPIWMRGQTTQMGLVALGEFPMLCGAYISSARRFLSRDPSADLAIAIPNEMPANLYATLGVVKGARSPNAALLLAGWLATDGQLVYESVIFRGSPLDERTEMAKMVKEAGAKVVFRGWDLSPAEAVKITREILEAWGFPKPINR